MIHCRAERGCWSTSTTGKSGLSVLRDDLRSVISSFSTQHALPEFGEITWVQFYKICSRSFWYHMGGPSVEHLLCPCQRLLDKDRILEDDFCEGNSVTPALYVRTYLASSKYSAILYSVNHGLQLVRRRLIRWRMVMILRTREKGSLPVGSICVRAGVSSTAMILGHMD